MTEIALVTVRMIKRLPPPPAEGNVADKSF